MHTRRQMFDHLDLVLDRFVHAPDGYAPASPLRQDGDSLRLGAEVVVRGFRFPQPGTADGWQGVLWLQSSTGPRAARAWNGPHAQLLALDRRWLVALSFAVPSTLAEALNIHDMAEGAEALTTELREGGWIPLTDRLGWSSFDAEIDELFDTEPAKVLDREVAHALFESPLVLPPFAEEKPTRYEPGSSERPKARVESDLWLTPEGAWLAFAAADLSRREGVSVLDAIQRVLAAEQHQ